MSGKMKRRQFLKSSLGAGALLGTGVTSSLADALALAGTANLSKVEARYYKKLEEREIECHLCPRECRLGDRERGYCGVRENIDGTYYTLVYGKACAINIDPIEKKPFFHFLPKTNALSIATAGCNVNCKFCQNWQISQVRPEQVQPYNFPPRMVVETAHKYRCPSIAYTYSEPIVFFEYMYDTSLEARNQSVRNTVVTGGHINPEPLQDLTKVVDAIKIDLKAFSEDFFKKYVRGKLQPVLEAIKIVHKSQAWLEIVYLVIPTLNDSEAEIRRLCKWIMNEIGPDVPLHFTRFHPMYLLKNLPPTPITTLEKAHKIAIEEGLHYVYIGNVPGHPAESTYCPGCGKRLIKRVAYQIMELNLKSGRCIFCNTPIPGVWA
ncbi:MAG: AmmeMemoRadiSam system radical SAM enzyme [Candidatus Aminicenantales bacterium]